MTTSPSARSIGPTLRERVEELYWGVRRGLRAARRTMVPVARRRVGGVELALHVFTAQEHYRADTWATKEPETIEWIRSRLRADDVLFDVGANVGMYSLYAARLVPSCRVVAFEPESNNFSSLVRNLRLNALDNVVPCCFPISDHEGFDRFHVYDLEAGAALHSLGGPSAFREGPATILQGTLTTTLDALVAARALPPPSLLKLDVDGLEERILDGAATLLESPPLRSILVEVTQGPVDDVSWAERKLAPHGFRPAEWSRWSVQISGLTSRNVIFDR